MFYFNLNLHTWYTHSSCLSLRSLALLSASWMDIPSGASCQGSAGGAVGDETDSHCTLSSAILWKSHSEAKTVNEIKSENAYCYSNNGKDILPSAQPCGAVFSAAQQALSYNSSWHQPHSQRNTVVLLYNNRKWRLMFKLDRVFQQSLIIYPKQKTITAEKWNFLVKSWFLNVCWLWL